MWAVRYSVMLNFLEITFAMITGALLFLILSSSSSPYTITTDETTDESHLRVPRAVTPASLFPGLSPPPALPSSSLISNITSLLTNNTKQQRVLGRQNDTVNNVTEIGETSINNFTTKAPEDMEEWLKAQENDADGEKSDIQDILQQLHRVEDKMNRQMKDIERKLSSAADTIRKRTNESHGVTSKALKDISTQIAGCSSNCSFTNQLLLNISSRYFDNINKTLESLRQHMIADLRQHLHEEIGGDGNGGLLKNISRHLDAKFESMQECTIDRLFSNKVDEKALMARLNCSRTLTTKEKADRDVDLLRNLEVQIMAKNETTKRPHLITLTPMVLARRLRSISYDLSSQGRGMVSVCYHNQPKAFTADHPLAPRDTDAVRATFNGAMDAVHAPSRGINLDVPNYINALLLELKNINRDRISLCVENNQADEKYENAAKCVNMLVKRK